MSKRVLLIKMTSMGDLMHALPALTDAARAIPGIRFDWVADEAFAEVASWHPSVNAVIKSAHRRWKKNLWHSINSGELKSFYRQLNAESYDIVVDGQNNLKSAAVCLLRSGPCHGVDKHSLKERPAQWAYRYQHSVDRSLHAIERQRLLMSKALGYELPDTFPDSGIDLSRLRLPDFELPERFVFFVHNASWDTKLWPESHWQQLITQAAADGYHILLPCGNDEEFQRASRLADTHSNAIALPRLPLSQVGAILNRAEGAVCCDTGLCHLAGLLNIPAVSLYGPTDHKLIGTVGLNQQLLVSDSSQFNCSPCYKRQCDFQQSQYETSACMASLQPAEVWRQLKQLIANRQQ